MRMLYSQTAYARWPFGDAREEKETSSVPHINPHRARVTPGKKCLVYVSLWIHEHNSISPDKEAQSISVSTGSCPTTTNSAHTEGPTKRGHASPLLAPTPGSPSPAGRHGRSSAQGKEVLERAMNSISLEDLPSRQVLRCSWSSKHFIAWPLTLTTPLASRQWLLSQFCRQMS